MAAKKKESEEKINIDPLEREIVTLQIIGVRPLIVHAWDPKTIAEMLGKQMKLAGIKGPKQKERNPAAEFEAARYKLPEELGGGDGVPAAAFKQAFVDACRHTDIKMTMATGSFHVRGVDVEMPPVELYDKSGNRINVGKKMMELIPIYGSEPEMRMDMVRLESGTADMRFRPCYEKWWCLVPVEIAKGSMTAQQVLDLANRAGFHCGICEWRPFSKKSKNGSFGMFRIARENEELALFEGLSPPPFMQ